MRDPGNEVGSKQFPALSKTFLMVHYYHSLSIDATIIVSKHCPITGEHVGIIFMTQYVTMATLLPAKKTLNFSFNRLYFKNGRVKFFLNIKF